MRRQWRWLLTLAAIAAGLVQTSESVKASPSIFGRLPSKSALVGTTGSTTSASTGTTTTTPTTSTTSTTTTTEEPDVITEVIVEETDQKAKPNLTGIPQIDYVWDPNLPRELNGFNLSHYPFLSLVPEAEDIDFRCDGLHDGFYASIRYSCQLYHHCIYGIRHDFLCANFTAFDQKTFICQFASEVDCKGSAKYWFRNDALYKAATTTSTTTTTTPAPSTKATRPPRRRGPNRRRRPYYDDDYYEDDYADDYVEERPRQRPINQRQRPRLRPNNNDEITDDRNYNNGRQKVGGNSEEPRYIMGDRRRPAAALSANADEEDYYYDDRTSYTSRVNSHRPGVKPSRRNQNRQNDPVYDDELEEVAPVRPFNNRRPSPALKSNRNRRPIAYDDDIEDERTAPIRESAPPRRANTSNNKRKQPPPPPPPSSEFDDIQQDEEDEDFSDRRQKPKVRPSGNGASIYNQPRTPPRINRPVPINERKKYGYVTSAKTAEPPRPPPPPPVVAGEESDPIEYEYEDEPIVEDKKPIVIGSNGKTEKANYQSSQQQPKQTLRNNNNGRLPADEDVTNVERDRRPQPPPAIDTYDDQQYTVRGKGNNNNNRQQSRSNAGNNRRQPNKPIVDTQYEDEIEESETGQHQQQQQPLPQQHQNLNNNNNNDFNNSRSRGKASSNRQENNSDNSAGVTVNNKRRIKQQPSTQNDDQSIDRYNLNDNHNDIRNKPISIVDEDQPSIIDIDFKTQTNHNVRKPQRKQQPQSPARTSIVDTSRQTSSAEKYSSRFEKLPEDKDAYTIIDDGSRESNQKPMVRVVKRPFLPSRGGSPYLPRGLKPLGGGTGGANKESTKIDDIANIETFIPETNADNDDVDDGIDVIQNEPALNRGENYDRIQQQSNGNRQLKQQYLIQQPANVESQSPYYLDSPKTILEDIYDGDIDVTLNDALNPTLKPLTPIRESPAGFSFTNKYVRQLNHQSFSPANDNAFASSSQRVIHQRHIPYNQQRRSAVYRPQRFYSQEVDRKPQYSAQEPEESEQHFDAVDFAF